MPSKQREQQHRPAPRRAGRGCALKIVSCTTETDCTKHLLFNHFGIFPSHDLFCAQPSYASLPYFSAFEINLSSMFHPLSLGHSACCFSSSLVFFPLSYCSFCLVILQSPRPLVCLWLTGDRISRCGTIQELGPRGSWELLLWATIQTRFAEVSS